MSNAAPGNVSIYYQYRDASNYKRSACWTVVGPLKPAHAAAISACMGPDGMFIPSVIGIPMLTPPAEERNDDDHPYHEIQIVEPTHGPADEDRTIDDLVEAFRTADWHAAEVEFDLETPDRHEDLDEEEYA